MATPALSTLPTSDDAALDLLLERCSALHTRFCPRRVLGVRLGFLHGRLLALELPRREPHHRPLSRDPIGI